MTDIILGHLFIRSLRCLCVQFLFRSVMHTKELVICRDKRRFPMHPQFQMICESVMSSVLDFLALLQKSLSSECGKIIMR